MLKTILLMCVFFWMYRYIGVLLYRIRHVSSDESTRISFRYELSLFRYILGHCARKIKPSLLSTYPSLRRSFYDFSKSHWQPTFKSSKSRPWYLPILKYYGEIYFWPWVKISPYIKRKIKYWRTIWWINERKNLYRSDWKILANEIRQNVKGVHVLGVRIKEGMPDIITILLKLPKGVSEIFGPCSDNAFSKFREEAGANNLRIRLKSHRYQDKERYLRTKKVVAEIRHHPRIIYKEGNFCGPEWRQNFISFLQKVTA